MPVTQAAQLGTSGVSIAAFLDLIAWSEGTSSSAVTLDDGYDVIVSGVGGPNSFTGYEDHPFAAGRPAITVRRVPLLLSTASGRYQMILSTWKDLKAALNLPDFTPASQDRAALELMRERGALALIEAGNVEGAITACSATWASLPGNDYGQGGHSMDALLEKWAELVGA